MKEVCADIWQYRDIGTKKDHYLCITTNGYVKRNGEAVMGRGVALQARQRSPNLPIILAHHIGLNGNHVGTLGLRRDLRLPPGYFIAFPVKHYWRDKADPKLIERSCIELAVLARQHHDAIFLLPRPGCGNGGLDWNDVHPICLKHFSELDNVVILSLP